MASAAMNGVTVAGGCTTGAIFNWEACLALGALKAFLPSSYYREHGFSPQLSPSHSGVTRGSPSVGLWLHAAWVSGPGLFCTFPAWSRPSARDSGILYPSKTSRIMWPASTNQGCSFPSLSPYPLEIAILEAWVCLKCFSLHSAIQKCRSSRSLKSWGLKRFLYSIV